MSSPSQNAGPASASTDEADSTTPWIGVDLDGTLAKFGIWSGFNHVGKPVKPMLQRIRQWQAEGYRVKIFTARASVPEAIPPVKKWLKKHKLGDLEVTNKKDFSLIEIWDDRCVHVLANQGRPMRSPSVMARPRAPLLEEAFPHENRPTLANKTFTQPRATA